MKHKLFVKLTTLLLACTLLTGCGDPNPIASADTETPSPSSETQPTDNTENSAPEEEQEPYILTFEATTIDGQELTSDCFAETKLTMINIWGTYCNPCLSEMPDLGEIASEYDQDDFRLIGIVCDVTEEDGDKIQEAKELIEETGANYTHLLLNQSLYSSLVGGVDSVPMTFFINQDSEMLGYVMGAQSKETWVSIIDELLAETAE